MNKKTIIVVSAVAIGSGLMWLITESEIRALHNKALNRDLQAMITEDPSKKKKLEQQGKEFMELSDVYGKIQKPFPWTYIAPYLTRLYYRYKVKVYGSIKQD